ncbi:13559_t:CDS:2, partial [Acaulospora morrowiae]
DVTERASETVISSKPKGVSKNSKAQEDDIGTSNVNEATDVEIENYDEPKISKRITRNLRNSTGKGQDSSRKASSVSKVGKKAPKRVTRGSKKIGNGRGRVRGLDRGVLNMNESSDIEVEDAVEENDKQKNTAKPKRTTKNSSSARGRHKIIPDANATLDTVTGNAVENEGESTTHSKPQITKNSKNSSSHGRGRNRNRDITSNIDVENMIGSEIEKKVSKRTTRNTNGARRRNEIPNMSGMSNIEVVNTENERPEVSSKVKRVSRNSKNDQGENEVPNVNETTNIEVVNTENERPEVSSKVKRVTRSSKNDQRENEVPNVNETTNIEVVNTENERSEISSKVKRVTRSSKNDQVENEVPNVNETTNIEVDDAVEDVEPGASSKAKRVNRGSKNSRRKNDTHESSNVEVDDKVENEGSGVSSKNKKITRSSKNGRRQNENSNIEVGSTAENERPSVSSKARRVNRSSKNDRGKSYNSNVNEVPNFEVENTVESEGPGSSSEAKRITKNSKIDTNMSEVQNAEEVESTVENEGTGISSKAKRITRNSKNGRENDLPNMDVEESEGSEFLSKSRRITRSSKGSHRKNDVEGASENKRPVISSKPKRTTRPRGDHGRNDTTPNADEVPNLEAEDTVKRDTRSPKNIDNNSGQGRNRDSDIPNTNEASDVKIEDATDIDKSSSPRRITRRSKRDGNNNDIPGVSEVSDIEVTSVVDNDDEPTISPKSNKRNRNTNSGRGRGRNRGKGNVHSGDFIGGRTRSHKTKDVASENDAELDVHVPITNESEQKPEISETPDKKLRKGKKIKSSQDASPLQGKGKTQNLDPEDDNDDEQLSSLVLDPDVVALSAENPDALQKAVRVLAGQNYDILETPNASDEPHQNDENLTSLFIRPVNPVSRSASFANSPLPESQSDNSFSPNTPSIIWTNDHWYQLKRLYEEIKDEYIKDGKNGIGNEEVYRDVTLRFFSVDVQNKIFGEDNIRKRIIALEAAEHERKSSGTPRRGSIESTNSKSSRISVTRYNSAYSNLRDTPINKRKRSESNATNSELVEDEEILRPTQRLRTSDSPSVSGTTTPRIQPNILNNDSAFSRIFGGLFGRSRSSHSASDLGAPEQMNIDYEDQELQSTPSPSRSRSWLWR